MTDQLTDEQTGPTYQVSWVETKNSETRQGALQRLGLAYVYTVVNMTLTAVKASLISILDTNMSHTCVPDILILRSEPSLIVILPCRSWMIGDQLWLLRSPIKAFT